MLFTVQDSKLRRINSKSNAICLFIVVSISDRKLRNLQSEQFEKVVYCQTVKATGDFKTCTVSLDICNEIAIGNIPPTSRSLWETSLKVGPFLVDFAVFQTGFKSTESNR